MRQVAGCVAIQDRKILLVTARKSDSWVLPKGGVEKNETTEAAALRELYEEAGIRAEIKSQLHEMTMNRKRGQQYSYWYLCDVKEILEEWPEKKDRQRKFVTVEEARKLVKKDLLPILSKLDSNL